MKGGDGRRKRARKVKEQSLYFLLKRTVLERFWKAQTNPKRFGADRHDFETWQEIILLAKLSPEKEDGVEETLAWHDELCCYSSPVLHHHFGECSGNECQSRRVSSARLWVTTTQPVFCTAPQRVIHFKQYSADART